MRHRGAVSALVAVHLLGATALPAAAQEVLPTYLTSTVELAPVSGTTLSYEGRFYTGRLRVSGHSGGLAVVETVTLDQYLLGIREVPFAWHREALRAQVVAARTYLAWTLQGGRSSNGRRYDYDICATTACQVYAGVGDLDGSYGGRWVAAVHETADEILLYQGQPAQAVYSSTSGGRTRDSEDVWPGIDLPYLQAVDSPGEQSPFVTWGFELGAADMEALLGEAGLLTGSLEAIETIVTEDGAGPWQVVIESDRDTRRVGTWELRGLLNRASESALPDLLPAMRSNGRRYPQTILSPTYTIERIGLVNAGADGEPLRITKGYRVAGRGWGHLVGMSQYGALAMAESGSNYQEILSHYYGGLEVAAGPEVLPDQVEVGLAVEIAEVVVAADGPVQVLFDGKVVSEAALGTWRFTAVDAKTQVTAPAGLGLPPRVTAPSVVSDRRGGVVELSFVTETAAELRVSVFQGPILVGIVDLGVVDAGVVRLRWRDLVESAVPGGFVVVIEARSPDGEHVVHLAVIPRAE